MSSFRKPAVLGLSWRKLSNKHAESDENEDENSPRKRSGKGRNQSEEGSLGDRTATLGRTLSRMQSVRVMRDALGSIRQKLRTSTRRRKRLINASPFTPKRRTATSTPTSVQRRSARLAQQREEKLYTPFNIDTPSKTPSKIRMGVHEPKRYGCYFSPNFNPLEQFNFSSPGQLYRDVNSVTDGIRALSDMSDRLNHAADRRTGIRTTPRRTPQKKPIFV